MKRLTSEEGLTPVELELIRKRAESATEGPWFNSEATYIVNNVSGDSMEWNADLVAEAQTENDTTFIVHAREDIPKLLAEVERLRDTIVKAERDLWWGNAESAREKVSEILKEAVR